MRKRYVKALLRQVNVNMRNVRKLLAISVMCAMTVSPVASFADTATEVEKEVAINSPMGQVVNLSLEDAYKKLDTSIAMEMVKIQNDSDYAIAKGYSEKSDNKIDSQKIEAEEEYIIIKNGSNNEECLVVKVLQPTVKGVAVIAQGAGNTQVKNAITQTVCALFDISTAKVSVEKMKA